MPTDERQWLSAGYADNFCLSSAHPWQFWKKINIKAVFLFGPESNLPSFFFCFERSQPCGGLPRIEPAIFLFLFWKIPALRWGAFIRSAIRKTTFMLDFYITMLKLFDRRGMRCSPYSSSVINTNHVVNIVSASKSVNVPLPIWKKHPSKCILINPEKAPFQTST